MSKQLFVFVLSVRDPSGQVSRYVKGPLPTSDRPRPYVRHGSGGSSTTFCFDRSELLTERFVGDEETLLARISELCKGEKPTDVIYMFFKISTATVVGPSLKKLRSFNRIEPRGTGEAPQMRVPSSALPAEAFLAN